MTTYSITFELRDVTDAPLVGAAVSARLNEPPLYESDGSIFGATSGTTDANGQAVINLLPSDTNQPDKGYAIDMNGVQVASNFLMPRGNIVWREYVRTGQPPAQGITPPPAGGGSGIDEADVDARIDAKVDGFALADQPTTNLPLTKLVDSMIKAGAGIGITRDATTHEWTVVASGTSTFTGLTDVPSGYHGEAGKIVSVAPGELGLEFTNPPASWAVTGDGSQIPDTKYVQGRTEQQVKDAIADWAEEGNTGLIPSSKLPSGAPGSGVGLRVSDFNVAAADNAQPLKFVVAEEIPVAADPVELTFTTGTSLYVSGDNPLPGVAKIDFVAVETPTSGPEHSWKVRIEGTRTPVKIRLGQTASTTHDYNLVVLSTGEGHVIYRTSRVNSTEQLTTSDLTMFVDVQWDDQTWARATTGSNTIKSMDKAQLQALIEGESVDAYHTVPTDPHEGLTIRLLTAGTYPGHGVLSAAEASGSVITVGWTRGTLGNFEPDPGSAIQAVVSYPNSHTNPAGRRSYVVTSTTNPSNAPVSITKDGTRYTLTHSSPGQFFSIDNEDGTLFVAGTKSFVNITFADGTKVFADQQLTPGFWTFSNGRWSKAVGKFTVDDIMDFIADWAEKDNTDRIPFSKSRIAAPLSTAAYNTLRAASNDEQNVLYPII